jgi:hypothetical protein
MHTQTHTQSHSLNEHNMSVVVFGLHHPTLKRVGTFFLRKSCISMHGLLRASRVYNPQGKVAGCSPFSSVCCLVSMSPLPHAFSRQSTKLITRTIRYRFYFALCVPKLGMLFHGFLWVRKAFPIIIFLIYTLYPLHNSPEFKKKFVLPDDFMSCSVIIFNTPRHFNSVVRSQNAAGSMYWFSCIIRVK